MATALARLAISEVRDDPAARRLVRFALESTVPEATLKRSVPVLLDTIAVMVAGGGEPGVQRLASSLRSTDAQDGIESFWTDARYRDDDAALLFGMASHVLDYDDVAMLAVCHPSVPIATALLAGGDPAGRTGRAFLDTFVIGTEVLIRLGQAMGFRHYELGYHATATLGTVGATLALCRLRGLNASVAGHAVSIAASHAAGLRANFGTHVKSLHVGMAASSAVRAVRLAEAGMEGAVDAIDGKVGFLHAFSGGRILAWPDEVELGRPFAMDEPGFEQKRYPCCYMLHKMIEGALALRRETGLDLAAVKSVRVDVAQGGSSALIHPFPKSGINALFSGPYAVAAALADGRIDLSSFTDEAVLRPQIQRRLADVAVVESDRPSASGGDVGDAPVTVTLHPVSGAPVSRTIHLSPGSLADPITPEQLRAKWSDCFRRARPSLSSDTSDALFDTGCSVADAPSLADWLGGIRLAVRS